jgi:hypothetical protein
MTKEKYLAMCEALGDTPDYEKMPPDYEDFPSYVHVGIEIFNSLPDNYTGGMQPIYCGKDLSALQVLLELYDVDKDDRMKVLDVIRYLDSKARKQAIREASKKK